MTIFINSYNRGSRGAKALKGALVEAGIKTILTDRRPNFNTPLVVFWGNSTPEFMTGGLRRIVNNPQDLPYLTNKLRFFNAVGHTDMVPEWSTNGEEAMGWQAKVMCRHRLEASGGAGIEVWEPDQNRPIPRAPLYTRYQKKTHEFRIHMARSLRGVDFNPILTQAKVFQKKAEGDVPKSWEVRNHDNGFVFVQNVPPPAEVIDLSRRFMTEHFPGLHFAALDVIWHQPSKRGHVLEGNTAPGLEGNTIAVYRDYLQRLHREA